MEAYFNNHMKPRMLSAYIDEAVYELDCLRRSLYVGRNEADGKLVCLKKCIAEIEKIIKEPTWTTESKQ